ncbi:MAG: hypothetical protein NVS2B12_17320 [Ktedonobacteraceae bacterium]
MRRHVAETDGTEETDELSAQLATFRATHTPKRCHVEYTGYVDRAGQVKRMDSSHGIDWEYFSSGYGKEALLLLPGVHGRGEMAFQHILQFEQGYRVISPSYPAHLTTVAQVVDGLAAILDVEQVETMYILGGSYSGMLAQCLVRVWPERVRAVVLDHTSSPSRHRARLHTLYRVLLTLLPLSLLRGLFSYSNQLAAPGAFWQAYFARVIATMSKEDYLSRVRVCIDFYRNYAFTPDDLRAWSGRILIIEADNDWYVPARQRAALKALYPQARVYTFHATGHTAWANQFATFFTVIAQFLQEEA